MTQQDLHDAAVELNTATNLYRNMQRVDSNLPNYEFKTRPKRGSKRKVKTLNFHPTKKVAKSQKKREIETIETQCLIRVMNARSRFQSIQKELADVGR